MGKRWVIALVASAIILAGCALERPSDSGQAAGSPARFALPESDVSYIAYYVVDENGVQTLKTVWRSKDRLRMRHDFSGQGSLDLFFTEGRAYSCFESGQAECFDITSTAHEGLNTAFLLAPDVSQAQPAEAVKIGSTQGKCYTLQLSPGSERKFCLAERGVLAYDEYSAGNEKHVEYATRIVYGEPDPSVFALPANVKEQPS